MRNHFPILTQQPDDFAELAPARFKFQNGCNLLSLVDTPRHPCGLPWKRIFEQRLRRILPAAGPSWRSARSCSPMDPATALPCTGQEPRWSFAAGKPRASGRHFCALPMSWEFFVARSVCRLIAWTCVRGGGGFRPGQVSAPATLAYRARGAAVAWNWEALGLYGR